VVMRIRRRRADPRRRHAGREGRRVPCRAALATLLTIFAAAAFGGTAPIATAVVPSPGTFVVRAVGDSVTAGFGYCGARDPACTAGYLNPATALIPCVRATYLDACSANLGAYPSVGDVFTPAQTLPVNPVSWADQFAVREGMTNYVNEAVTGSTPEQWAAGDLSDRLASVLATNPDLTLLTLGANPVLHSFYTNLKDIACLFSINPFESEARLLRHVRECVLQEFRKANSHNSLIRVYETLLKISNNHILALEYHTPWPVAFPFHHYIRKNEVAEIIRTLNEQIGTAIEHVALRFPGRISLVATPPWGENHQCLAKPLSARWVIDLDFCIHPTRAGYTQLMDEVVSFARAHPRDVGFGSAAWAS
jgi:hypothetical protein